METSPNTSMVVQQVVIQKDLEVVLMMRILLMRFFVVLPLVWFSFVGVKIFSFYKIPALRPCWRRGDLIKLSFS